MPIWFIWVAAEGGEWQSSGEGKSRTPVCSCTHPHTHLWGHWTSRQEELAPSHVPEPSLFFRHSYDEGSGPLAALPAVQGRSGAAPGPS